MEDVLSIYNQEVNPRICFDERPCQLIGDVIAPLPMKPGNAKKEDNEYERKGTCVVLLTYNIDTGERFLQVRKQRTKKDYAEFMDWLKTEHFPNISKIQFIQDNLNTHTKGSFYENLPQGKAKELADFYEFHFTLEKEALEWQKKRNEHKIKIHWSFTVANARAKMKKNYQKVNAEN